MTVSLIATIQRWEGFSTDDKPVTDVREGSTFRELDTGKKFVWNNSLWAEDLTEPVSTFKFSEKQNELRRLSELQLIKSDPESKLDGHYNFIEIR